MRIALCLLLAACGSTTSQTTTVEPEPEPVDAGPPTFLVDDQLATPAPPDPAAPQATGEPVFQYAHRRGISDLSFSADGRSLASASPEGSVAVIDVESGQVRASRRIWIRTADRRVAFVGHRVVVVSSRSFTSLGGIRVWDLHSGTWTIGSETNSFFDARLFEVDPRGTHVYYVLRDEEGQATLRRAPIVRDPDDEGTSVPIGNASSLHAAPDGRTITVAFQHENRVEIRHADTLEILQELAADGESRWGIPAYRPNGGALATPGNGGVVLRDPRDGSELRVLPAQQPEMVTWSEDGSRLFVFESSGVAVHDGATGTRVASLEGDDGVRFALPSADGEALYVVEGNDVVRVATDGTRTPLDVTEGYVTALAVSPDGRTLAVGDGADVVLVDTETNDERARVEGGHGEHSVWGVRWAPDSRTLATWGRGGVELWGEGGMRTTGCRGTGSLVFHDDTAHYVQGMSLCQVSDGAQLELEGPVVATSGDGERILVDTGSALSLRETGGDQVASLRKRGEQCSYGPCQVHFSMDRTGERFTYVEGDTIHLAELRGRRLRSRARVRKPREQRDGELGRITLSPSGESFVAVRNIPPDTWRAYLYDARGRKRAEIELDSGAAARVTYSDDGSLVALVTGESIQILDAANGEARTSVPTPEDVQRLDFTDDGQALAALSTLHVAQWGLDGAVRMDADTTFGFDLSRSGEQLAMCDGGWLVIREPLTDREERLGECGEGDQPVFSPDGRFLALRRGAFTQLFRVGTSHVLTLRTPRMQDEAQLVSIPLAHDERGRFAIDPAQIEHVLLRGAGPIRTAPMRPVEASAITADLVASFFGASPAAAPDAAD